MKRSIGFIIPLLSVALLSGCVVEPARYAEPRMVVEPGVVIEPDVIIHRESSMWHRITQDPDRVMSGAIVKGIIGVGTTHNMAGTIVADKLT